MLELYAGDWVTHRQLCDALGRDSQSLAGKALNRTLVRLLQRGDHLERREITDAELAERGLIDKRTCWLWRTMP